MPWRWRSAKTESNASLIKCRNDNRRDAFANRPRAKNVRPPRVTELTNKQTANEIHLTARLTLQFES